MAFSILYNENKVFPLEDISMMIKFPMSIKLLSLILSIAILVVSLPLSAIALNLDSADTPDQSESRFASAGEESSAEDLTSHIEYELTEYRDAFSKQFKRSDGTVMLVAYGEAVHTRDASGKWVDIDNTLVSSEKTYHTTDNRVSFSKSANGVEPFLTLRSGDSRVQMFISNASRQSSATVMERRTSDFTDEASKLIAPAQIESRIHYADVLNQTDLEYSVCGSSIKETILVKEAGMEHSYAFLLDLDHLEARACEDGSVHIYDPDADETVYILPAPYMFDTAGEKSEQVKYILIKQEAGKYTLTITADSSWINSPDRVFPVSIDPTFLAPNTYVTDLNIVSVNPNYSYPEDTIMYVSNTWRGYWKTSLPNLPASAYISYAYLSLYSTSTQGNYVGVYPVTTSWDSTLTWNKTIASVSPEGVMANEPLDYQCVNGNPENHWYDFNITKAVRAWFENPSANYGVGFRPIENTFISGNTIFRSNDHNAAFRPRLVIVYKDMKGLESYWPYSEQDLGLAGTGYVNLATGSLSVVKPLLSTTDYLFPYTPTITYHSSMAGKAWAYPNAENSFSTSYMPYGFKLNITETIIKKQFYKPDGTSSYYYIWSDADGTEHAFYSIGDSETYYQDEDGLQMLLTIGTGQCTLTDDSKTVKTFSNMGNTPSTEVTMAYYLQSIKDRHQNTVSFAFSSNYKPVSVTMKPYGLSNAIYFLTVSYTDSGLPYLIWNQSTKDAIIFRYSSTPTGTISATDPHYLRELVYAHGNSSVTATNWLNYYNNSSTTNITVDGKASYTYNTDGCLISCKDHLSDHEIRYTQSNGKISLVQEYGSSSSAGQKIGLAYYDGYTEFRGSGSDDLYYTTDDLITRYTFDEEGRTVSVWSTDYGKTQVYGAATGEYEKNDKVRNNLKSQTTVGGSPTNYLLNGGFERVNSNSDALYWNETANVLFNSISAEDDGGQHQAYFTAQNGVTDSIVQNVRLPKGTYTLSMSVNTYRCENVTVQVRARSLSDSAHDFSEDVPVNDFYASGTAQPFSMTFDAADENSGYEYFEISISVTGGYIGTSGEVSVGIDNVMLEESIGYSSYSMVEMGNFEMTSLNASGTAYVEHGTDFWQDQSNTLVRTSAVAPFGYAGQVNGSISEERYIKQRVYTASAQVLTDYDEFYVTTPVTTYLVSGFAKGTGQVHSPHSVFGLRVDITYYNGSNSTDSVESTTFCFQDDCTDWQFVSGSVSTEEYRCVKAIDVLCVFARQPGGYALFDDIAFSLNNDDSVIRYGYYDSGDLNGLLHVKETSWYTEVYEYNSDRQLIRVANNRGELYDYTYAVNGVDVSTETYYTFTPRTYPYLSSDPDSHITKTPKLRTTYTYNNYGQVTNTSTCEVEYNGSGAVVNKTGTKYMTSSSQYQTTTGSKIFGALLLETDTLGRQIRYYYDSVKGYLLASVNVGSGTGTCYYYDALGNLENVYPCSYDGSLYDPDLSSEFVCYFYDSRNRLDSIETDSTGYVFTYDNFGNKRSVSIWNNTLAQYTYQGSNGKLSTVTYGNGFRVRYVYDELERVSEIWHKEGTDPEVQAYAYTYTTAGQLHRVDDLLTGKSTTYKYNASGKLIGVIDSDNSSDRIDFGQSIFYNDNGQVSSVFQNRDYTYSSSSKEQLTVHYSHSYKTDGRLNYYKVDTETTTGRIDCQYDAFNRLSGKTYSYHLKSDSSQSYTNTVGYTFSPHGNNTSAEIKTFTSQVGNNTAVTWTYTYDENGNITKAAASNGTEYRYCYDKLGQLTREDNTSKNRTYVYTYDNAGNILTKKTYALTAANSTPSTLYSTYNYVYGDSDWGDLLTSYRGTTITYDSIGNPLSYYNGNSYTFTWEQGRRLKTAVKGSYSLSFAYNEEGIRISKTVNGTEHKYTLSGSQIISEEWGSNLCIYLYDSYGSPIGMQYRTNSMAEGVFYTFWFEKNLQGDVVAIYNSNGIKVFSYTYDAWGNTIKNWINSSGTNYYATYNPFTYRGYYYDSELGMYYLQSRYYDPAIGRFINADTSINANGDILGFNMFAYCGSNPVMGFDPTGEWNWRMFWDIVVTAVSIVAGMSVTAATGSIIAGIETTGIINNTVNSIYYHFSKASSDLEADSNESSYVQEGYIDRWSRLDYVNSQLEDDYNPNAWRYYSEYSVHMYGWFVTGWAFEKEVPIISKFASQTRKADISDDSWDTRLEVLFPTLLFGILGF